MKQFLLEILTTELETDCVEPFDYLKIRKEILDKSDQELKPIVEDILAEAYVNEDITLEDFEEIMNELNEEDVELDERQANFGSLKTIGKSALMKKYLGHNKLRADKLKAFIPTKSGLSPSDIKYNELLAKTGSIIGRMKNKTSLPGRVLTKVADSYNIDEDFEINEIIDSVLNEE
jgi:hypothetical protein